MLIFKHDCLSCIELAGFLFDAFVNNSIRTFTQFSDSLVFLSKQLSMLEGRVIVGILSLDAETVIGGGLGIAVTLQIEFLLNHGLIFADEGEVFQGFLDFLDL